MRGVPPIPLTKARTVSPRPMPRSDTIGSTSQSAISSTVLSFSRRRPGSPWIPMPTSTSSSPSSKLGGDGRGEGVAGAGGIEHAQADESAMERLVARATTRNQGDLATSRAAGSQDDVVGRVDLDDVRVRLRQAGQALRDDVLHAVEELLHRSRGGD